jgi:predicted kinase
MSDKKPDGFSEKNTAFVMVGAPGAGKSFLARTFIKSHSAVIIEGDSFAGDSWVIMHDQILEKLEQHVGEMVILDGTHYSRESRLGALITLRSLGWETVNAVVVHPPLDVCISQNAGRSRVTPRYTIVEMHKRVEKSLKKIEGEGFSSVVYAAEGEWV